MGITHLQTIGTIGLQRKNSRNITLKNVKLHLSLTESFQFSFPISTGSNIPFKKREDSCYGLFSVFHFNLDWQQHSIQETWRFLLRTLFSFPFQSRLAATFHSRKVEIPVTDCFEFSISISTGSNIHLRYVKIPVMDWFQFYFNLDWQQHSILLRTGFSFPF